MLGSLVFFLLLLPFRIFFKEIVFYLFVFLLIAVTNPLFVHKGETILFFLNDNPVTFEAIIYGICIALMLVAVIFWSKSYSLFMTSDKFVYLFGRLIPKLSLVLSMALRFIPLFKQQIKKVNQTQKALGLYTSDSIADRILGGIRTFNSMMTWSLENAIQQADAMKAKGYGLKGRTHFSIFPFYGRDIGILVVITIFVGLILWQGRTGHFQFAYYPTITALSFTKKSMTGFAVVLILMMLPAVVEIKERIQWKYVKSKM